MTKYILAAVSARPRMKDGSVSMTKIARGDTLPDGIDPDILHRMLAHGAAVTQEQWDAYERIPHHLRTPHRSANGQDPRTIIDPENGPAPAVPTDPVDEDGEPIPAESDDPGTDGNPLPDLSTLNDDALASLWEGSRKPLVSHLVERVGDDPDLARRVLTAEDAALGGAGRETLTRDLTRVIEGDE